MALFERLGGRKDRLRLLLRVPKVPTLPDIDKLFEDAVATRDAFHSRPESLAPVNPLDLWLCAADNCPGDQPLVTTRDGDLVCAACGTIKRERLGCEELEQLGCRLRLFNEYDPLSHVCEKLAQAVGATPPIPPALLELCDREYQEGDYPRHTCTLHRDAVSRILSRVRVPGALQKEFQSTRYHKRLCEDLHRQKYFNERWVSLRWHWLGVRAPRMTSVLAERVKLLFTIWNGAWAKTRHGRLCDNTPQCHKVKGEGKCHKNRPPYNFIFGHLWRVIRSGEAAAGNPTQLTKDQRQGQPCPDLFRLYMPYMPCLRESTYRKYNLMVEKTFLILGWYSDFEPITFATQWTHEWFFGLHPNS